MSSGVPELVTPPQQLPEALLPFYPNVRFEPGYHPLSSRRVASDIQTIAKGNLRPHAWSKEVAERLDAYHPTILSSDSARPLDHTATYSPTTEESYLRGLWYLLPDRPSRLNPSGRVYLVAGDLMSQGQAEELSRQSPSTLYKLIAHLPNIEENIGRKFVGAVFEPTAIVGGAYLLNTKLRPNKKISENLSSSEESSPTKEQHHISRRSFIKAVGALGLIAASSILRLYPTDWATEATSEAAKEHLLEIADKVKPQIFPDVWLNGRTALVVTKQFDAMKHLGMGAKEKGAVVMGDGHAAEAYHLMHDAEARAEAIRGLAKLLLKAATDITHEGPDRIAAKGLILTHLKQIDIYSVTDGFQDATELKDRFRFIDSFESPSIDAILQ